MYIIITKNNENNFALIKKLENGQKFKNEFYLENDRKLFTCRCVTVYHSVPTFGTRIFVNFKKMFINFINIINIICNNYTFCFI